MINNEATRQWLGSIADKTPQEMGNALPVQVLAARGHRQRGGVAGFR